jgi:hypothetical protein
MSVKRIAIAGLPIISLAMVSACGIGETLGLGGERGPDEYRVISAPPLSVPPEFDLKPPQKGGSDSPTINAAEQAKEVLRGKEPNLVGQRPALDNTIQSYDSPAKSAADSKLLEKAGATESRPDIRSEIDADAKPKPEDESKWSNFFGLFGSSEDEEDEDLEVSPKDDDMKKQDSEKAAEKSTQPPAVLPTEKKSEAKPAIQPTDPVTKDTGSIITPEVEKAPKLVIEPEAEKPAAKPVEKPMDKPVVKTPVAPVVAPVSPKPMEPVKAAPVKAEPVKAVTAPIEKIESKTEEPASKPAPKESLDNSVNDPGEKKGDLYQQFFGDEDAANGGAGSADPMNKEGFEGILAPFMPDEEKVRQKEPENFEDTLEPLPEITPDQKK